MSEMRTVTHANVKLEQLATGRSNLKQDRETWKLGKDNAAGRSEAGTS